MSKNMEQHRGCFIIIEGTDGSGKSTLVNAAIQLLQWEGKSVSKTSRSNPYGEEHYVQLIRHIDHLFVIGYEAQVPTHILGLASALEHSIIYQSQVLPALNRGEIIFAESWWGKTWIRLWVEAKRLYSDVRKSPDDFKNWTRHLCRLSIDTVLSSTQIITVLIDTSAQDRKAWYMSSSSQQRVYDIEGKATSAPEEFMQFTQEIQDSLLEVAKQEEWIIISNSSLRAQTEVAQDLAEIARSHSQKSG